MFYIDEDGAMIVRTWRGWTRPDVAASYASYVRETGLRSYASTPGNLASAILTREDDGRTEFLVISFWESLASIEAFAGSDVSRAVFYPEDDAYLIDRDWHVNHYEADEVSDLTNRLRGRS